MRRGVLIAALGGLAAGAVSVGAGAPQRWNLKPATDPLVHSLLSSLEEATGLPLTRTRRRMWLESGRAKAAAVVAGITGRRPEISTTRTLEDVLQLLVTDQLTVRLQPGDPAVEPQAGQLVTADDAGRRLYILVSDPEDLSQSIVFVAKAVKSVRLEGDSVPATSIKL